MRSSKNCSCFERFKSNRIKLIEKIPLPELPKEIPQMKFKIKTQSIKGVLIEIENVSFSYLNSQDLNSLPKIIFHYFYQYDASINLITVEHFFLNYLIQ